MHSPRRTSRHWILLICSTLAFSFISCGKDATAPSDARAGGREHPAREARRVREENKVKFKRFMQEVASAGNFAVIDELVADSFVEHQVVPGMAAGREGVHQAFEMLRTAFPDLQVTVEQIAAEDDLVFARSVWRGTHQGEYLGIAATGKAVEFEALDVVRFADGKAVEHWGLSNDIGLMTQLGAMSAPTGASEAASATE